ncbi:MAG: tetratricopeptide repeat protein [Candidatus Thorarchaeota archaeon]
MPDSKLKEIIHAEDLISKGKKAEALELLKKLQQTAQSYLGSSKSGKALEITFQSRELIEKIGTEIDLGNNFFLTGQIYFQNGKYKESLKNGLESLKIREKLDNRADYGASLYLVGSNHWLSGRYNKAIEYSKKSLAIKEINPLIKVNNLNILGNIYLWQGNLSQSLKYCEEGIKFAKEGNFLIHLAQFFYGMGLIHNFFGDFTKAKKFFMKSLEISDNPFLIFYRAFTYLGLISIFIEENSLNQVEKYLENFRNFEDQAKNKYISNVYLVAKGMTLHQSSRTRDRAEAERLFKEIVDGGVRRTFNQLAYMYALYSLIFMYVEEFRISLDLKIIEEIKPLISTLYKKAEQLGSSLFQIQGKIFQAKIKLIQKNYDQAKILLIEAQRLAELTENHYFAQIISDEHDRLLELQTSGEQITTLNSKPESIKLASLHGIANLTQRERSEGSIEIIPEIPVLLLIIAEGGVLIFSYPFTDEWKHDTEIFSSFLSAFNTFSDEFFSKGLDRVKFGDETLLIQSFSSFSIGYLYRGQSYPAKQKLTSFIEDMQNEPKLTDALDKFFKASQVAELKDIPQIESLIKDIFVK